MRQGVFAALVLATALSATALGLLAVTPGHEPRLGALPQGPAARPAVTVLVVTTTPGPTATQTVTSTLTLTVASQLMSVLSTPAAP